MTTQPEHHRKVSEDSPDRCQAVAGGSGQCNNVKVPGCEVCIIHGGWHQQQENLENEKRNYRLTRFRARVNQFADHAQVKSLREEVGIARLQLEELMNTCKDSTDLLMYSERIAKLVAQIQGLVLSCQRLEEKSGNLLDKTQLFVICEGIVKIIGDHVADPDTLDIISTKIMEMMTKSIAVNPLS